jgi:hypothetical protein
MLKDVLLAPQPHCARGARSVQRVGRRESQNPQESKTRIHPEKGVGECGGMNSNIWINTTINRVRHFI